MIEKDIRAALVAAATSAGNRVYPLKVADGATFPAAVYTRVSTAPVNSLDGHSGKDSVRVQIDCYAKTYDAAKTLAGEVRAAMGALKCVPINDADLYEEDVKLYRVVLEFNIWQ